MTDVVKEVRVTCQGAASVPLDELLEFQGNLKTLTGDAYVDFSKKILELGFSEPVAVWVKDDKKYIINGHQRVRTLKGMRDEGYKIPEVPISWVYADSLQEAKKKVLSLTSQYGMIENKGLFEFMTEAELEIDDLSGFRFPTLDMEAFKLEYFDVTSERVGTITGHIKSVFNIVIEFKNENELKQAYEKLSAMGYLCRPLIS